ncbi:hypothetical protein HOD88_03345 [archaeon]|jgi:predicted kinase|nr:hypothetical protein [archaeon]
MKPKIVILRGRPTSGKSTAFHTLKKRKELKNWIFVDFCNIKETLGETLNDSDRKKYGKKFLFAILKEALKTGKNILMEEMSEKSLRKSINYSLKKYNYKVITFQFSVSTKTAYKRDVQRAKDKWHPLMGKKWVDKAHKLHDKKIDPKGIIVDTDKLSKKKVIEFIMDNLNLYSRRSI